MKVLKGAPFKGIDLLAGGLPCPPFSIAGKQLGEKDERNLFPAALRLIDETRPRAIMIENVRGFLDAGFLDYREKLRDRLYKMGYLAAWRILNAPDFGVPQLRPRVIIVALKRDIWDRFDWPQVQTQNPTTVGQALYPLMKERGWSGAEKWRDHADESPISVDIYPFRCKLAFSTEATEMRRSWAYFYMLLAQ